MMFMYDSFPGRAKAVAKERALYLHMFALKASFFFTDLLSLLKCTFLEDGELKNMNSGEKVTEWTMLGPC